SAALFATSGWPVVVAVLGGAAGAGLATLACRIPITFLSTSLASRRGRDIVTLVTVVLFVGGYTAYVLVATRAESVTSSRFERIVDQVAAAAQILEWTPFGVAWALGPDAVDGRWGRLGLHAALTLAYLAVGFWLFARLLDRGLTNPPTSRVSAAGLKHDAIARWAGRLPRRLGPARAVAARCWVNYRRDPRYTAVLPLIVLFPVLLTLMARLGGSGDGPIAWLGVGLPMLACGLTAFMAGYSLTNDVGSDATAWWVHLSSAVPGWADRLGRVAAQMGWCLPLVVATGVVVPVVVGQPDKAAAAVGTMLGLYLVSLGVASVSSGLVVYPIALPGESPFSTKTGNLGTQFVAQMAESLACVVVAGPVIAVGLLAPNGLGWLVIVAGLVWGAAGLAGGVVLGGRIVDRRGPAILDTLRKNDTRVRA
ncbi:MAG: hypothetical protein LBS56_06875, partial [Propionibacteriaceae bacterium]|nr:hypothetical protein [Propionibacteriaceae bacterium]